AYTCYRICYNIPFVIKGGELRLFAKERVMAIDNQNLPELVKEIRKQLALSQEGLARKIGISFATVNRWENGKSQPSKLGKAQFDNFCARMTRQGKLKLSGLPAEASAQAGGDK
ncbi:MAG: helix-turn-helix transcriptional regulator, partial [Candidatus Hydrogenedentes bacterium]|nr:helix-turn-helix transcriptional regulator [Candidatus Hydrogenedentota bacterium]